MGAYLPGVSFKKWYGLPIGKEDQFFVPNNYKETISFLKENLKDDEGFFSMTSEGFWYYVLDKPCPTRFQIVWFAVPYFYQQEVVKDLQRENVKYILVRNSLWSNRIDGIPNQNKLPIIFHFINNNYIFHKIIDDNEIWIKK
jgi:hypothetical protein